MTPKYAVAERERRFLLAGAPAGLPAGTVFEDRYLLGTGLRLRTATAPDGTVTRKLGHKVRDGGPGVLWHTSLYPDAAEWTLLRSLGGVPLRKSRHLLGELPAAVDVFAGPLAGLVLAEVDRGERPDDADLRAVLAGLGLDVVREVTGEEAYTGGALASRGAPVEPVPVAPDVQIRPLDESDWPQVVALVQEVAAAGETYALDHGIGSAPAREFWSEAAHHVVAVDPAGTVLGTAKAGPNRPAQGSHVGTASFLVTSAARGQGVGRALGEYVVDWHRANGFRGIQFNAVVESNTGAVRLWQSLGFAIIGTVPGAFRRPSGEYAGLHVMYLDLTTPG